jgi:hypothetical protein
MEHITVKEVSLAQVILKGFNAFVDLSIDGGVSTH